MEDEFSEIVNSPIQSSFLGYFTLFKVTLTHLQAVEMLVGTTCNLTLKSKRNSGYYCHINSIIMRVIINIQYSQCKIQNTCVSINITTLIIIKSQEEVKLGRFYNNYVIQAQNVFYCF